MVIALPERAVFKRIFLGFCCLLVAGIASADVSFGSSRSFVLAADLYASDTGTLSGTLTDLFDQSPASYAQSYGPSPLSGSEGLLFFSATQQGSINSNVDGSAGSKSTNGSVQLTNLMFGMEGIFTVTADELSTFVESTGDFGALSVNGSFGADNVVLEVLGNNVALSAGEVYNQNGLRIFYQDGATSETGEAASISATAFLVFFDDFVFDNATYNGSIALGFARAEQRAVPEPSTLLVLGGLGALALRRKRRA
jgi:hypothetical protein